MEKKKKRKNSKQFNREFKKRFFTKKSATVIGLMCIIVLFLGLGILHQRGQIARYQDSIGELTSDVKAIKNRNQTLEEEKETVGTDEFRERVAREKLGLVGEGEYALKEADSQPEAPGVKTDQSRQDADQDSESVKNE